MGWRSKQRPKIKESIRTKLKDRSLEFNQSVSNFVISASSTVQVATGRGLVDSSKAINHLHGSLSERGKVSVIADTSAIRKQVPEFSPDSTIEEAVT